jgi:hypothetical protein
MSQFTESQKEQILNKQRETAAAINALIEQSRDALLCGPDCQTNKTATELEEKYINAQMEMVKAPSDLANAKKNYYVFTEGQSKYNDMLEEELKQKANKIGDLIKVKFNEEVEQAKILNVYLNSDIINSKNTIELYKTYFTKNETTENLIKHSHGDILTNDRKTYYENQENDSLKGWYTILLTSYYIIALVYFGKCILSYHLLPTKIKIGIVIFLIIIPYIIDPITRFIISIIKKIGELLPKDVYL